MATTITYEKSLEEVRAKLDEQLQKLRPEERYQLLTALILELATSLREQTTIAQRAPVAEQSQAPKKTRSIMELRGLGKELWRSIDSTEYLRQERDSWD